MNTLNLKYLITLFMLFIGLTLQAAGTIQQVKNGKVLVNLEGTFTQVGDQFFGLNAQNQKTSIFEITTIRNDQAVGKVLKGNAVVNDKIELKTKAVAKNTAITSKPKQPSFIRHDLKKMAFNLKLSTDVVSTKQQDNNVMPQQETVDMSGSNFGLSVSLDLPWENWFDIRGYAGYEMMNVKGTAQYLSCDGKTSTDCNAKISYLTAGGLGRLKYIKNNIVFWGGLGLGFKQPLSKKSTALTESNIALANTAIVAFGLDYHVNNQSFIPFSFEYHKSFNESDTVPKIGHMALLIGYGFMF